MDKIIVLPFRKIRVELTRTNTSISSQLCDNIDPDEYPELAATMRMAELFVVNCARYGVDIQATSFLDALQATVQEAVDKCGKLAPSS